MKIVVTGASGMVGSILVPFLKGEGHQVLKMVRHRPGIGEIYWNPESGDIDSKALEGIDAIINLAGENIGEGRWTEEKKKRILETRVKSTELLSNTLLKLKNPPKLFLNASAVGYYGDQGNKVVTEESPRGEGFLADVCVQWENAAKIASQKGINVILMRFGAILCVRGGALGKVLVPFKLGLGGVMGSGEQYMSWITIDDVLDGIAFLLKQGNTVTGPVNMVTPKPVTNYQYTKTMGRVLRRPTFFRLPSGLAKLIFGQMAEELILSSTKAIPNKLVDAGYKFHYPEIKEALSHLV